jgi:hypothetical protein
MSMSETTVTDGKVYRRVARVTTAQVTCDVDGCTEAFYESASFYADGVEPGLERLAMLGREHAAKTGHSVHISASVDSDFESEPAR